MTATAFDTMTVSAAVKTDAPDMAKRQWATFGYRVVRFIGDPQPHRGCLDSADCTRWRVTAELELVRS